MLTFEEMFFRFVAALVLGALLGVEREFVGKEAGVRTEMLVAGGASLFAMVGLVLPYLAAGMSGSAVSLIEQTNAFGIIANIVVGIGFLGAGLIIRMNDHPHGVTTAALVWTTAAIGILTGIGMVSFAAVATVTVVILLYGLRKVNIFEQIKKNEDAMNASMATRRKK